MNVKEAYKKVDAAYKVVRSLRDKSETPAYAKAIDDWYAAWDLHRIAMQEENAQLRKESAQLRKRKG